MGLMVIIGWNFSGFNGNYNGVYCRDARYTGTVKLPVFIIFKTVQYHNFA